MNDSTSDFNQNSNIVILTGAGISAESGLPTFRAVDGLWEGHRVEDVATPEAFMRDPALVHQFYNDRRAALLSHAIKPNPAHKALAQLEQEWPNKNGGEVLLVTQNIDNLHERAGSKNLLHMHGELLKKFCTNCRDTKGLDNETVTKTAITSDLNAQSTCEACNYAAALRPDIVWFGEMPYYMARIYDALQKCSLFISIGTSGNVYPAAGFVSEALNHGAHTIELNLDPTNHTSMFDEHIQGKAGEKVPALVSQLLS